jgi:hypothetical protein
MVPTVTIPPLDPLGGSCARAGIATQDWGQTMPIAGKGSKLHAVHGCFVLYVTRLRSVDGSAAEPRGSSISWASLAPG